MAEGTEKQTLVHRVKQALNRFSLFGKIEQIADNRRNTFNRLAHEARREVLQLRGELKWLRANSAGAGRIEDCEQLLSIAEYRLKRRRRRREYWRNRYVWARARHKHWGSVLRNRRDRLRAWIQRHDGFQPYMANGHPYEKLTEEAKYAIYLDFKDGNYVTSTYEGYPGDGVHSISSGHYVQNQPDGRARCWDSGAGSRGPMVKAQRRERRRCQSFLVELIGPDNDEQVKHGIRYGLSEGDPLEDMHDNHKHTWIRDGAPVG